MMSIRTRGNSDSEDEEESRRQADVAQLLQQRETEPSVKRTKYDVWHNEDETLAQAMRPGGALMTSADDDTDVRLIERGPETFQIPIKDDSGVTAQRKEEARDTIIRLRGKRRIDSEQARNMPRQTRIVDVNSADADALFARPEGNLDAVEQFGVPLPKHEAVASTSKQVSGAVKRSYPKYARPNEVPLPVKHVELSVDVCEQMLTDQLCHMLSEKNNQLMESCIRVLGKEQCIKLVRVVEEIQSTGGMRTLDRSRLRTPGGVFFYIVRQPSYSGATAKQLDQIFGPGKQAEERIKKRKHSKPKRNAPVGIMKKPQQNTPSSENVDVI